IAEDVTALLAPVAGDAVAVGSDVAGEVELVAVAGAMQLLLQAHTRATDLVIGLAANVFGRAVGERDGPAARPCAIKTYKRAGWLRVASRHRQHQCGANAGSLDRLSKQTGAKKFHIVFSHSKLTLSPKERSRHIDALVSRWQARFKGR